MKTLLDLNLSGKKVLLRLDLNTPIQDFKVSDDERILRSMPTIRHILDNDGKLTILSHLGRPEENGVIQVKFSLDPVAKKLKGSALHLTLQTKASGALSRELHL